METPYWKRRWYELSPEDQKFWDRWYKIEMLADSPNSAEAETAIQKSRALLDNHVPRFTQRDIPERLRKALKYYDHWPPRMLQAARKRRIG